MRIRKSKFILILTLIIGLSLFLRLWHIEFGLPQTFPADEPEIAEVAIFHTFELKNAFRNNDIYKLIPVSYVYGTFPAYLFTFFLIIFVQFSHLIGFTFEKLDLFIFMRIVNAGISVILIPTTSLLAYKLFNNKYIALITAFFVASNWKLIVHAHYLNADLILTLLFMLFILTAYYYYRRKGDTLFTVLTGIFFGVAVGTKITALIAIPAFLYLYLSKKDILGFCGFIISTLVAFVITNPFSLIFVNDFAFRVFSMTTQEAGLVFDSVNTSPEKYLIGLAYMMTPLPLFLAIAGLYKKSKEDKFSLFILLNIAIYFVFYTLQSRRVDRWLLPTLPLLLMYSSAVLYKLIVIFKSRKTVEKFILPGVFLVIIATPYLYYPFVLLKQFQRQTPKSEAYLWAQSNLPEESLKYVLTEEGQDPFTKLLNTEVYTFNVYESQAAHLDFPPDTQLYEYYVISSRPTEYFDKQIVKEKYPHYYEAWKQFIDGFNDSSKYEMVKKFETTNPNLIPLSEVSIYRKI